MSLTKGLIIAALVVWLQLSTLPALRPFGVVPNLALVAVILLAARLPLTSSLGLAVGVGWLLDLGSGSDYGLRTTFYLLAALAVAMLRQFGSDLENLSLVASIVVTATVLLNLAILANLALLHVNLPLGYIAEKMAAEIACNLVLLVIVRWIFNALAGRTTEMALHIGGRRG